MEWGLQKYNLNSARPNLSVFYIIWTLNWLPFQTDFCLFFCTVSNFWRSLEILSNYLSWKKSFSIQRVRCEISERFFHFKRFLTSNAQQSTTLQRVEVTKRILKVGTTVKFWIIRCAASSLVETLPVSKSYVKYLLSVKNPRSSSFLFCLNICQTNW